MSEEESLHVYAYLICFFWSSFLCSRVSSHRGLLSHLNSGILTCALTSESFVHLTFKGKWEKLSVLMGQWGLCRSTGGHSKVLGFPLRLWISTFLMLQLSSTVPHDMVKPKHEIIFAAVL